MRVISGNLWDYANDPKYILCVTTNGFVKKNGEAVMGRGCALEAAQRYPQLPKDLGYHIKLYGNTCGIFHYNEQVIFTFPVKHNWWEQADLELIKKSVETLQFTTEWLDKIFILPRPGCKNGGLNWAQVEPIVSTLPDNVWVIDFV